MAKIDSARITAIETLVAFETRGTTFDNCLNVLDTALGDLRDRSFARQLVFGVLRWQGRIDWILGQLSHRRLANCVPYLRQVMRLGVFQLLWLDRVPPSAAVHTSVELAKKRVNPGAAKLVNAVLRALIRQQHTISYPDSDSIDFLAVYYSHPAWLVKRWLKRWGRPTTLRLLKANNSVAPLFIHFASQHQAPQQDIPYKARPTGPLPNYYRIDDAAGLFQSELYKAGTFQVQDIQAGLAASLLAANPGERVLDTCAAPGGKTVQLGLAMANTGFLLATDRSPTRLSRVKENGQRLGLSNIQTVAADACQGLTGYFDRILVDAPCSGTGTLGRHPDARWRKTVNQLPKLAKTQYRLLASAFALLRPGGTLVYSTCSLEIEENDQVVNHFLHRQTDAELVKASIFFPNTAWAGNYVQTIPGREIGDGSFAARIHKRSL